MMGQKLRLLKKKGMRKGGRKSRKIKRREVRKKKGKKEERKLAGREEGNRKGKSHFVFVVSDLVPVTFEELVHASYISYLDKVSVGK